MTPQAKAKDALSNLCKHMEIRNHWSNGHARGMAYKWLAEQLGTTPRDLRINDFDSETCARITNLCSAYVDSAPSMPSRKIYRIDVPEPGFYQMRIAKGAPSVGVHIAQFCHCSINGGEDNTCHVWDGETCDRSPYFGALVNNEWRCVYDTWIGCCDNPITEAKYQYLIADRAWAAQYAPDTPEARPWMRVDTKPRTDNSHSDKPSINIRDIPLDSLRP